MQQAVKLAGVAVLTAVLSFSAWKLFPAGPASSFAQQGAECVAGEGGCGTGNNVCSQMCEITQRHCLSLAGSDSQRVASCAQQAQECNSSC